jgi:phosphoadenylyl-sulfate reductase (thioredoxin)
MDRFSVGAQLASLGSPRGRPAVPVKDTATTAPKEQEAGAHSPLPRSILKPSAEPTATATPSSRRPNGGGKQRAVAFDHTADAGRPSDPERMTAAELLQSMHAKHGDAVVVSTNFGPNSAVILHLATRFLGPNFSVVWVDTGYLSEATYRHAEKLTKLLNLNLEVYQPVMSRARMEAIHGKLWETNEREFGRLCKVEPMKRALNELNVRASVVGLRRSQLGPGSVSVTRVSKDGNERYRVLPIFDWSDADMAEYMRDYNLPAHEDSPNGGGLIKSVSFNSRHDALRYAEHGISSRALTKDPNTRQPRARTANNALPSFGSKKSATAATGVDKCTFAEGAGVEVYTRVNSALCKSTKKLLEDKNLPFTEYIVGVDIDEDALVASIEGGSRSAPFVFIGGTYVGGFNDICERLGEDPRHHAAVWGRNVAIVQVGLV